MRRVTVVFAVCLVASACSGDRPTLEDEGLSREIGQSSSTTVPSAATDQRFELRLAAGADWSGDPADAGPASLAIRILADLQFEGLVAFDGAGKLVPALAARWSTSSDRLMWTFTIADDLVDHDGVPVTSRTVMRSLDRVAARGADDVIATSLTAITGWSDRMAGSAGGVAGITAPLDDRLVIRLDEPFEPLLEALAAPALGVAVARGDSLVGTGAYQLDETSGDLVAVDPEAVVGTIEFVDAARIDGATLLERDQADWAVLAPGTATDELPGDVVRVPLDVLVGVAVRLDTASDRRALGDVFDTVTLSQLAGLAIVPPSLADGDRGDLPAAAVVDVSTGYLETIGGGLVDQLADAGVEAETIVSGPLEFGRRVSSGEAVIFPIVIAGGAWSGSGLASVLLPSGVDDVFGLASEDREAALRVLTAESNTETRMLFADTLLQTAVDEGVIVLVGRFDARVGVGPRAQGLSHRSDGTLDLSGIDGIGPG